MRGGEREGAQQSAWEEGRGGHRGVSGAAAPGWGPPGGAFRDSRPRVSAPGRPRLLPSVPGGGPRVASGLVRGGNQLGSPDGLTWRWIELHHLPCLDLFCSRSVPLLLLSLLQGLVVASFRIISRKPKPKEKDGFFLYFISSLRLTSCFFSFFLFSL